ncbi:MAG: RluA family pseudouridine synthase [Sulfurovum sp.]|jgi:23S rRNA pseudouridine1911/1915/1917 synthase|nr:MAG: RluA family pseudouridine synthase [Sulfurovum sp.]
MENAYKLLAIQKNISNSKAKELIDRGIVYIGDQKVKIARGLMDDDVHFRVEDFSDIEVIFEDFDIIAVNKPAMMDSYDLEKKFEGSHLIHRLDRETSGVLLLAKNEEFLAQAIDAFKKRVVVKEYVAWIEGIVYEEMEIKLPISTYKRGGKAFSKVDMKLGKSAITKVKPQEIQGKKSKVSLFIESGRTHQIRVHLSSINHPIVGDSQYGSKTSSKRILLHAKAISLLGYNFEAREPKEIYKYK